MNGQTASNVENPENDIIFILSPVDVHIYLLLEKNSIELFGRERSVFVIRRRMCFEVEKGRRPLSTFCEEILLCEHCMFADDQLMTSTVTSFPGKG